MSGRRRIQLPRLSIVFWANSGSVSNDSIKSWVAAIKTMTATPSPITRNETVHSFVVLRVFMTTSGSSR